MENYKSIYCRAKSIMQKEEDAQALMKEVYALAEESGVAEDKLEAWLIKKTYILGCDKFRKKKAREAEVIELQECEYEMLEGVDADKTKEIICETLEELPDLYQATLFAFYYDQYSVKEVAAVTGYREGVVVNRLNYIHKYLSRKLENYQEENGDKVQFSVELVYDALKQWAKDNSLDETEESKMSILNNVEAVKAELRMCSVKKGLNKKQLAIFCAVLGGLAILAIVISLFIGIGKDKEEQKPEQLPTENQDQVTNIVEEEESEEEEVVIEEETTSESEYILPDSNVRTLTRTDLQGLTKEELRLARNEIYARYGVIFGVADLDAYFAEQSWYEPTITLDEFEDTGSFSADEYANIKLIIDMESEME